MKPIQRSAARTKAKREKIARARELRQNPTPGEAILWAALRRNQLGGYHFRRQEVILGYIVDFYCHKAKLVVEVDGEIHTTQEESDQERDAILAGGGYQVLRIKDQNVRESLPDVLERILTALRSRTFPSS